MGTSTADAAFTNTANWQGVDDEPTAGSDNLLKSGGVAYKTKDIILSTNVCSNQIEYAGKIVSSADGTITAASEYNTTYMFRVKPSTQYVKSGITFLAYYDENKNFISRPNIHGSTLTTPSTAHYARVTSLGSANVWQLNEGDALLDYEKPATGIYPYTDATLLKENVPADAKEVGERIAAANMNVSQLTEDFNETKENLTDEIGNVNNKVFLLDSSDNLTMSKTLDVKANKAYVLFEELGKCNCTFTILGTQSQIHCQIYAINKETGNSIVLYVNSELTNLPITFTNPRADLDFGNVFLIIYSDSPEDTLTISVSKDNPLSESKSNTDRIGVLETTTSNLGTALNNTIAVTKDHTIQKVLHSYINTSVGTGVQITDDDIVASQPASHIIVPCKAGDIFTIVGYGGSSPRLWAFTDVNMVILSVSAAGVDGSDGVVKSASQDGYIIVNTSNDTTHPLSLTSSRTMDMQDASDEFENIEKGRLIFKTNMNVSAGLNKRYDVTFKPNVRYIITFNTAAITVPQIVLNLYEGRGATGSSYSLMTATPQGRVFFSFIATKKYQSLLFYFSSTTTSGSVPVEIRAIDFGEYNDRFYPQFYQFGLTANGKYEVPAQETFDISGSELEYFYGLFDSLVTAYPNYIEKVDCDDFANNLGIETPDYMANLPIYMYKFIPSYTPNKEALDATATDKNRLKVMILGGTHPEYMGIWDLYQTMRIICENWTSDENLQALRWEAEYYILPCSGPYGVENRSRTNYNGVDLNRNMPTSDWYLSKEGTNTYSGASPSSEYETKVLIELMKDIKPNIFIDHHNTSKQYPRILMYITSRIPAAVEIGVSHIQDMSLRWKKRFTSIFAMDNYIYGFAQRSAEPGLRSTYACEQGALGFTYESQQSLLWSGGVIDNVDRLNTADVATLATDGFLNFLLRVLKTYSAKV